MILMQEKIKILCNQVYEDIQSLRESGNYDVEKRLGVEIMALNAMCNAVKTISLKTTNIEELRYGKRINSRLEEEKHEKRQWLLGFLLNRLARNNGYLVDYRSPITR